MSQAVSGVLRPDSTQKQNERTKIALILADRSARVGGRGSCPASPDAALAPIARAANATAATRRYFNVVT